MPRHPTPAAPRRIVGLRFGVAGLLLVVLASCAAGGTTPKPSASTLLVRPSPTPVDVAQAFVTKMSTGKFSAYAKVTGTIDEGTMHGTLDGTYAFSSADSHYEITISTAGTRLTTQGTQVAGLTYKQNGYGPWLQSAGGSAAGPAPADLSDVLTSIANVQDVGIETKAGRPLHHLRPPGGLTIPPSAMGVSDPGVIDPHATLELYAESDGTLAATTITMTWRQATGATTSVNARMVMDIAFSNVGGIVTVTAPSDVWQTFTSKRVPYTMAYPGDWATPPEPDGDFFRTTDDSVEVWVYATTVSKSMTQRQWTLLLATAVSKDLNVRSDGGFAVEVGGVTSAAAQYHGMIDKRPTFFMLVPVVHNGKGYEIQWYSIPGSEKDDIALFKTFLASFAFTR